MRRAFVIALSAAVIGVLAGASIGLALAAGGRERSR
jgi:hypothetical protein